MTYCGEDYQPGILHWSEALEFLRYVYTHCHTTWANGAFDHWVAIRAFPELKEVIWRAHVERRVHDVQLRQRLIDLGTGQLDGFRVDENEKVKHSYSLAALYERYGFGQLDKSGDTYRLRYGELIEVPLVDWPQAANDYAKLDAKATRQVHCAQDQFEDLLVDGPTQAFYAFARRKMVVRGMITDAATCDLYLAEVHEEIEKARKLLLANGLLRGEVDFETGKRNPPSKVGTRDMKRARERMERVCREADLPLKKTKKDGVCLDAEATRDCGDPVLQAYSLFTSADTVIKKVTMLKEGSRGLPLQCEFVNLLENGRCSTRIPKEPLKGVQMQNLPKVGRMRNCFVARPGYALVDIDFNMHELVTVAQVQIWLGASHKLADALNAGRDVHCDVGCGLMGVPYEEMLANKKQYPYVLHRNQSKEVNFGGWGQMTARRLRMSMNKKRRPEDPIVDDHRAAAIMRAWSERWEAELYFDAISRFFPGRDRWALGCLRQFMSDRVRAYISFPDACNGAFSGLAADAAAMAYATVCYACELAPKGHPLYDCHPVLTVHDSIMLEVPLATLHVSAMAATEIYVQTAQGFTPDVKLHAEPAASLYMDKDAEPVFKNGELQLWGRQAA